jgi:hypothetical protein
VHLDLVGPLPASAEDFKYLFTMVDRPSRWLEAAPLKSLAAEDCLDALISSWVARFGVPSILTSDQGRQFTSSLWAGLTKLLGIKHVHCSDHRLPPTVQWDGGEDAWEAEGRLEGAVSWLEMARAAMSRW